MAFDALTSSATGALAASLSRTAFWMPVTVVAHHGPVAFPFLQLRFSTCESK